MKKIANILFVIIVMTALLFTVSCSENGNSVTEDSVNAMVSELRTSLAELIEANKAKAEKLELEFNEKVQALEAKDTEYADELSALKTEYDAKIKETEDSIAEDTAALEATIDSYEEKITALETANKTSVEEITALKTAVESYKQSISDLQTSETANKQAIEDLKTKLDASSAKITVLEGEKTKNDKKILDLKTELEAKITELQTKIAENTEMLDTITEEYNALVTEIENAKSEITSEIENLRTELNDRIENIQIESGAFVAIDATLTEAGSAADAKATGDAIAALTKAVNDSFDMLMDPKPRYAVKYQDIDMTSAEAQDRLGKYVGPGGEIMPNSAYNYTEYIPVEPGDTVFITNRYYDETNSKNDYKSIYSMRMIAVYDENKQVKPALGLSVRESFKEFVVPEGGAYVVITYHANATATGLANPVCALNCKNGEYDYYIKDSANSESVLNAISSISEITEKLATIDTDKINALSANIDSLNAKIDSLDVDRLNEIIDEIKNLDKNNMNITNSAAIGSPSISATAEELKSGEAIELENNAVINNKNLTFSCDLSGTLANNAVIRLGHGKDAYGATYIEITPTNIKFYAVSSSASMYKNHEHNLNLTGYVTVVVDCDYGRATVSISTTTGTYDVTENWSGRNGKIFAEVENATVTNAKLRWYCEDYQKSIWMIGDSYFSSTDASRWTSYLITNGYKNMLMMSYSGMPAERGITEFKQALNHGTPKYAVWCMGMNNGDSASAINAKYLAATEEFLALCEQKGITPILSTIPSTPTVLNSHKNAWVENWANEVEGRRYIDFSRAVGGNVYNASLIGKSYTKPDGTVVSNTTGYEWYANMLYADLVHPAAPGAKALYMQALLDFPELMKEN